MNKGKLNNIKLAQLRTILSNQRTFLSYIRTGFAVSIVALKINSQVIISIGALLICYGVYQYYEIAKDIEKDEVVFPNKEIPLTFTVAGLMLLYYYWYDKKKNGTTILDMT